MQEQKASSLFSAFPFPSPCDNFSPVHGGIFCEFLGGNVFLGFPKLRCFFSFFTVDNNDCPLVI